METNYIVTTGEADTEISIPSRYPIAWTEGWENDDGTTSQVLSGHTLPDVDDAIVSYLSQYGDVEVQRP